MSSTRYLGVFSGSMSAINKTKLTASDYWHIWLVPEDDNYILLCMDPKSPIGPCLITAMQFRLNFTAEKRIHVPEPETAPDPETLQYYKHNKSPFGETARSSTSNLFTASKEEPQGTYEIKTRDPSTRHDPNPQAQDFDRSGQTLPQSAPVQTSSYTPPVSALDVKLKNINALRIHREYVADLGLAVSYWKRGKKALACTKLDALINREDDFVEAHKHVFTECSIEMRKIKSYERALAFALRAVEVSPNDSHVCFNAARAFYELKKFKEAHDCIKRTLELDPTLAPALKMQTLLEGLLDRTQKTDV